MSRSTPPVLPPPVRRPERHAPPARVARFAAVALLVAGCASARSSSAPAGIPADHPVLLTGDAGARARARADSARRPYTEADIHFMSGMISHHAQAIVMARWAESHDASPSVRTLAGRIINAQQDEILLMQHWLRDRDLPVPEAKPVPMKMTMGGMEHEMLMPGMLSDAQLKELDAARGLDFDRLFLTFMIQHHKGAVTMVEELFRHDGAAQDLTVFKFASDVNVDQSTEIARMEKMLVLVRLQGGAR
ncbi:MAG TPA: DUF305 domain-containing protein [Gemmatimonadaceae bacterium]|nr:DUF305 domain-containing protein [Gemmatimonadaceae bacterium]